MGEGAKMSERGARNTCENRHAPTKGSTAHWGNPDSFNSTAESGRISGGKGGGGQEEKKDVDVFSGEGKRGSTKPAPRGGCSM